MTAEQLLRTPHHADPRTLAQGHRVLLATDDSEAARAGEEWVRRLRWASTPVVDVVTVAPRPGWAAGIGVQTYRPAVREAIDHGREARLVEAQRVANAAASRLQQAGMLVRIWARGGEPADEIVRASRLESMDLIVVGCAGRSSHAFLRGRSVSREVARHADVPVLIALPPPSAAGRVPRSIAILDVDDGATATAQRWLHAAGWLDGARLTLARMEHGSRRMDMAGDRASAEAEAATPAAVVTLRSGRERPTDALASLVKQAAVDLVVVTRTPGGREADLATEVGPAAAVSVLLTVSAQGER